MNFAKIIYGSKTNIKPIGIAMDKKAILSFGAKSYELGVIEGTENELGLDISQLRSQSGLISLDPGYVNTGSCESAITYIDGEKGILRYRGIPIEQFVDSPNFIEVAWLLIFGNLPNKQEYDDFVVDLRKHANLDEGMKHHFEGFPRNAPPMAILSAMINALSCFYPDLMEIDDTDSFRNAAARLISKVRTIAAYAFRHSHGRSFIYPDPNLLYVPNFLHMMFSDPYKQYICSDTEKTALTLLLILHADHEQNCSTSTVRMVGSSQANVFASCSAGVSALWGPLHGGANVAVMNMLQKIHDGNITPEEYVKLAKDKNNDIRLMGFGHRVYKNFDPRARILSEQAQTLLSNMNRQDPLLDIARKLEEIALNDSYFVERKLYPNVDFYSGIILRALGIPTNMFTVMFSIGRLPGWIAHWWEQHQTPGSRISRPRQIYTGSNKTDYLPMEQR